MAKFDQKRESQQTAKPPQQAPRQDAARSNTNIGWHPAWRVLASVMVVLHVLAVFSAPWDLSTLAALPPGYQAGTDSLGRQPQLPPLDSEVWQEPIVPRGLRRFFRHYLNLMYLNHGYEFFAPDPGGSNIIRYTIRDSGGQTIAEGQFPDLEQEWPRLFYHRHLMLAAQTGDMGPESGRHYAQHLLKANGGQTIRLEWLIHALLSPQQVADGTPLDAPQTKLVLANIDETAGAQVGPPPGESAVTIPGSGR
ncbi:hypothetical protein [Bythopirellula polymerisocia]|uniref:Uncharacterized protein n=1 Tax=Bythopirellula polymerisocia TaxID=2528003 RepID=A0A5C6CLM9_9BACT|nr:hypothetical protein [Bythopirellula polymerisocia]TWU24467.1 hypothetical protein Pla144_33510 [Bythopirellula polymerisocia]